jgi:DNA-binding NtrC family response regulator
MRLHGSNSDKFRPTHDLQPLIYVVEDQDVLLELATVILEQNGYVVRGFSQPKSALQAYAVASPPPALMVTDFAMEGLNGLELIERCRLLRPDQKALLISGAVNEDTYSASTSKPDAFLRKPYAAQQLVHEVEKLLQATRETAPRGQFAQAA